MGFFSKFKKDNSKSDLLEGVTFSMCLNDLFGEPDEAQLQRASAYYEDRLWDEDGIPESSKTIFTLLLQYHEELPQDMEIVSKNIRFSACELIGEADDRDPYTAKALHEQFFAKWPRAFHNALRSAQQEDNEMNLIFLACVYLFGWDNGKVNMEEVNVCVEKLDALDDIENYDAYEWLKREAGK